MTPTHTVFVPGAGLGGWIWGETEDALEAPHLVADYPGRGEQGTAGLGLHDYALHVCDQIDDLKSDRVVLVAHSLGGVVALMVAERLGDRLAGFIGVGAAIPKDGGSFVSSLPLAKPALLTVLLRVSGTKPPDSAIRKGLCSDLPSDRADKVVRRFVPESRAAYLERTGAPLPGVPRLYVLLPEDREFGVPLQRAMASNLGAGDVREIASGHLPMLSRPNELARIVNEFVG